MTDRLPASLAYILIYNPTLPPHPDASRDDEDAQEEAHILFYTSRERAVSRDRMLRQVGLAKALVNFADIFTPGQGCDNVHSQGKRMVHVSPEPDFWMHACIDLPRTQKLLRDDSKATKYNDHPQAHYHHEDTLHDLAIRNHLHMGYETFKLLHGSFTSVLETRGSEGLQAQLEHFFTPWAWKWDLDSPVEFSAHLGQRTHPLGPAIAPFMTSFLKDLLPSSAIPLLVYPPYIIDLTDSKPYYPPSLPLYLLSLVPAPDLQISRRSLSKRQDSSKNTRNIVTSSTNTTLGFLSAAGAGMGGAMNVKNWSWPESLMFGKQKPSSKKSDTVGSVEVENKVKRGDLIHTVIQAQSSDVSVRVEGEVDQLALEDATSNQNRLSSLGQSVEENGAKAQADVSNTSSVAESQSLDDDQSDFSPNIVSTSTFRGPPFSVFQVFLSEPSDPLVVRRRRVFYLSMFQMVFAVLVDVDCLDVAVEESLRRLQEKIPRFLEDIRQVIDSRDIQSAEQNNSPNSSRHIIASYNAVSVSEGFSSTSSLFFEGQETLSRDPETIEIFSRTGTPHHWYVARRGLGFDKLGDKVQGEAYLEAKKKDMSLVDADNELVGTVRRWMHRSE